MPYNAAWGAYIPDKTVNKAIARWHEAQAPWQRMHASPSTLTECPRVVWLRHRGVPPTNPLGWGKKQRFMLGRQLESLIVRQLDSAGDLLHWWQDDEPGQSIKFEHGNGLDYLAGTPDLLLNLHKVAISDAKTSRSDSFKFVPVEARAIWTDPYWYKYKLQLTAYFMLCHWNKPWFEENKLPLPEICHLFSYALDDGIVRRELSWTPTKLDANRVNSLVRRWNEAYVSETLPDCTCPKDGGVKFCMYGVMNKGDKVCKTCCDEKLVKLIN